MIDFQCPECGKDFHVPDHRAGRRGRCPQCKVDITVPGAPAESPAEAPSPGSKIKCCRSRELQDLFENLIQDPSAPIIQHEIIDENEVALQLATGPEGRRRQGVSVFLFDDEDMGESLCVVSQIGSLPRSEHADVILRASYNMVGTRVSISPDGVALVLAERRLRGCHRSEFVAMVKRVARNADRLENAVFEWDMY